MFIYFWVPTTYDNANILLQTKIKEDIHDIKENQSLFLELTITEDIKNLNITLISDSGYRKQFLCRYINSYENGMFVYSIDQKVEEIDISLFKIQVYHIFKSFFHKHVFHSKKRDKILGDAYIADTPYDIQNSMKHYLETYRLKYLKSRELLYSIPKEQILTSLYKNANIVKVQSDYNRILKLLRIGKGELIFAKYLANDYLRRFGDFTYVDILEMEERYLNIFENDVLRALENAEILYTTAINEKQDRLTMFGLFLSLLGLIAAFK